MERIGIRNRDRGGGDRADAGDCGGQPWMPRPYSVGLRERVVCSVEEGLSCRETAERFHVSISFVIKLVQRWRQLETVAPQAFGGHKTSALSAHADGVRAMVV